MSTLREKGRQEWTASDSRYETINAGNFQRIADATEKMAVNWQSLTTALEREREASARYRARAESLERRLRAQKAATTRAKRGKVPPLFARWRNVVRKLERASKDRR